MKLQIRLADLDSLHGSLERLEDERGLLSADEKAWSTPAPLDLRRRRRSARIALRLLLARSGVASARAVPLTLDAYGKPHLPAGAPAFSVSHSAQLALIAIAPTGPIGIDIEADRNRHVQLGTDRQALICAAAAGLVGDGPNGNHHRAPIETATFLSAWTCLEAFGKARGSGIGVLLTDLGITAAGSRTLKPADVDVIAATLAANSGSGVTRLDLPMGSIGAIASPVGVIADNIGWQWLEPGDCSLA